LKIGLFDVSNVEQPEEVAIYVLPQGSDSEALYEPKAILFSYERNLFVLPVTQYNWGGPIVMANGEKIVPEQFAGVYAFEITPKSIGLKGKISHGTDWNQNIRRSMFIKNTLFTVSESAVYANSMTDLAKVARVELKAELCGDGICDAGEKECKPCYAQICPMVCLPNTSYCEMDCGIKIN
ncbi:MAG: beta-propeller domain-containing protein, partial [Candidatus Woesearchaeota archaeon]|nr:beta-propeller domain-containing protein [Candidatus Woesearchaeota archaeon]